MDKKIYFLLNCYKICESDLISIKIKLKRTNFSESWQQVLKFKLKVKYRTNLEKLTLVTLIMIWIFANYLIKVLYLKKILDFYFLIVRFWRKFSNANLGESKIFTFDLNLVIINVSKTAKKQISTSEWLNIALTRIIFKILLNYRNIMQIISEIEVRQKEIYSNTELN